MRVLDQDAVHGQLAPFVHEGFALGGFEGGVSPTDDERFVAFEPADFQEVEFRALGADVGDVPGDGAPVELALDSRHGAGGMGGWEGVVVSADTEQWE